jgi:hypothetical protein
MIPFSRSHVGFGAGVVVLDFGGVDDFGGVGDGDLVVDPVGFADVAPALDVAGAAVVLRAVGDEPAFGWVFVEPLPPTAVGAPGFAGGM